MTLRRRGSFARDERGATIIEFAILAPAVIALFMGILFVGIQMRSYNSLRSIAADVARYTVVEYQKSNTLEDEEISAVATAIAVHPPYAMTADLFDATVSEDASPVAGTKKFTVTLTYTPFNALRFYNIPGVVLTYNQNIFVPL